MLSRRLLLFLFLMLNVHVSSGRSLEEIKRSGKIYVAFTSVDLVNVNHDLALEFARYLNVEMIELEIDWDEVFMNEGVIPSGLVTDPDLTYTPDILKKADIICSTFSVTEWRKKLFSFAKTMQSAELLVIDRDEPLPGGFGDLAGKSIAFLGATTFEQHLNEINSSIGGGIQMIPTRSSVETKRLMEEGGLYGIIQDADEALNFIAGSGQRYKIAFPISDITQTAWAVEKNNPLAQEVENFFKTILSNGVLDELFISRFGITYASYLDGLRKNLRLERHHRDLDEIIASRKLIVALRDRNFVYREDGQKQFMHVLAEELADYLGVSLEFVVTPDFERYWETKEGKIFRDSSYTPDWFNYFDLACETFAPADWRSNKVNLIPVYQSSHTVIARKDVDINSIDDLQSYRGVTGSETVYEDFLRRNGITNYYPENVNNFLSDVVSGKADYTILYNTPFVLSEYPELEGKLEISELNICWAMRKDQPELQREVEQFLERSRQEGLIGALLQSLHGNTLEAPEAFINSYFESLQTGQLPNVSYGTDDGLPQEDVFSIFLDRKGYLWFGTNSGAARYNGREMVVFNREQGLPSNSVRDINQDSSGTMYFATTSGIAEFRNDSAVRVSLEGTSCIRVFVDSRNEKWIIGDNGVYREDQSGIIRSMNSKFPELPEIVYDIAEDPEGGHLLLATISGVYMISGVNESVSRLSDMDSYSLLIDNNDSLWISTDKGLLITHVKDFEEDRYNARVRNLNERLQFPVDIISDITTSRFGSVWLVADSKIIQVISTEEKPIVYEEAIGIKNNKILSFLIDQEDNIWIGFSGGLHRLTNRRGLRNFFPGVINSNINSAFEDSENRLWIASDNGIFYFQNDRLVNFTSKFRRGNTKFAGTLLPNNNIILANNEGLYEVSKNNLEIIHQIHFSQVSHSIDNIFVSSRGEIFLLTGINGVIYYFPSFYSQPVQLKNRYTANIFQLIELDGRIIGGNSNGFVTFTGSEFQLEQETESNIWSLCRDGDDVWVGTDIGIGKITAGRFDSLEFFGLGREMVIKTILPAKNRNYLWVGTNKGFSYFNIERLEFELTINTKDGLSGDEITSGGLFLDRNDLLWVGTYHGISNFNIRAKSAQNYAPPCYIENIFLNGDRIPVENGRSFSHKENSFIFEVCALSYSDETSVEYEYYLRGMGHKFTSYHRGSEYRAYYSNLPPGGYEFIYKAKGKNNVWGYAEKYEFSIRQAWFNTWIFRITLFLFILVLAYLFYIVRINAIKAQKERLVVQVKERTQELELANTEIEAQRDEIEAQRDEVEAQRDDLKRQRDLVISQKNEIVESISYAQRIQEAMLPPEPYINELLDDVFILFKPRDIVSGDFYWIKQIDQYIIIVAADCTGHGVPGAFMSMLGISYLNEIAQRREITKPSQVLDELRYRIMRTLRQHGKPDESKDGIDMAICVLEKRKRILQYSGAYNPLYLIQDENGVTRLNEIKANKMPVGYYQGRAKPFTNHEIQLEIGDAFYIFSDGFIDQKGGKDSRKFMSRNFKNLLVKMHDQPMYEQKRILEKTLEDWMDGHSQMDDILIIGGRI